MHHIPKAVQVLSGKLLLQYPVRAASRAGHLQEAERAMLADQPLMPLYFYVTKRMVKPWVQGYEGNIMDHIYTRHLHILKH